MFFCLFPGKILDDDTALKEYKISEKNFVVVLVTKVRQIQLILVFGRGAVQSNILYFKLCSRLNQPQPLRRRLLPPQLPARQVLQQLPIHRPPQKAPQSVPQMTNQRRDSPPLLKQLPTLTGEDDEILI